MQEREGLIVATKTLTIRVWDPGQKQRVAGAAPRLDRRVEPLCRHQCSWCVCGGDVWKNRFLRQALLSPGLFAQTDFTSYFPESIEAVRCESSPFPPKDLAHLPFSCPP